MIDKAWAKARADGFYLPILVGDYYTSNCVVCRRCGCLVPIAYQPAIKAHLATCQ